MSSPDIGRTSRDTYTRDVYRPSEDGSDHDCKEVYENILGLDGNMNSSFTSNTGVSITVDGRLPFFDFRLTKIDNKLATDIFQNNTFTGLGLNFFLCFI